MLEGDLEMANASSRELISADASAGQREAIPGRSPDVGPEDVEVVETWTIVNLHCTKAW